MESDASIKSCGVSVLKDEAAAVLHLSQRLDDGFVQACQLLTACRGRVVLTGVGKSAHIARKISSTLSSVGIASFFVHPTEAGHGDLGMIKSHDVAVILSNSGESNEVNCILPSLEKMAVPVIAIGSCPQSRLATAASVHLNTHVTKEAGALGLVPTSSSTTALALGDALAMATLQAKKFSKEDFARVHPHGRLGRQLLLRVSNLMRTGKDIPRVKSGTVLIDTLCEISEKGIGMTLIVNADNEPIGIFTDGDLRRSLEKKLDVHSSLVDQAMTTPFHSAHEQDMAVDALHWMQEKSINSAPVLDNNGRLVGAISIHILLQAGV